MIPKGLIVAISVGMIAGAIFGIIFVNFNDPTQLQFSEGPSLSIITEKIDFHLGENITIQLINSGTIPLVFSDASYGLKITRLDTTILYSPISAQVISTLEPNEVITFVWDQIKSDGEPISTGIYRIASSAFDAENKLVKKAITINILK